MIYDLLVVGGGSGGVRAARIAASFGARVAIIEDTHWGGTCVNVGCVPKKMYHYVGSAHDEIELAQAFGWQVDVQGLDWSVFFNNKQKEIERLQDIYQRLLVNSGVETINGFGRLISPTQVQVDDVVYEAKHILIAVGGVPVLPEIKGIELALNSNQLFALDHLPKRMLVFGGGYIACEMASTYHKFGVAVHLVARSQLLRSFDQQTVDFLKQQLKHEQLHYTEGLSITQLVKTNQGIQVSFSDGTQDLYDVVLMATGRAPRFAGLGLDTVGVALDNQGLIEVSADYQTSVPSIYAVGDIVTGLDLTPVALAQGMYLARHLFGKTPVTPPDLSKIATTIFTHPQVATIGASEEDLIAAGTRTRVYQSEFRHLKYTVTTLQHRTFMKLLIDDTTDRILGIHLVGHEVGEIMQGFAVAVQAGLTKAQLDQTIGIHPTAAEELVTMREPNRIVGG
ncbi:MAG: glutathione-disulfide reductase [Pseudomonadota bacterium]|nr:glutathione-disulfide reductase [Pseudomonadota bacterium]